MKPTDATLSPGARAPLALVLGLLCACGATPSSSGPADAASFAADGAARAPDAVADEDAGSDAIDAGPGAEPDAALGAAPSVEVGTGRDGYEPLAPGAQVALAIGPQGGGRLMGYHIWGGLRARGFDPVGVTVHFQILDATATALHAEQERIVALEPASGEAWVAYGLAPRIDDCCAVEGREVVLRVALVDRAGRSGADERRVLAGECLDTAGARVCD